jgi:hypothetical protein
VLAPVLTQGAVSAPVLLALPQFAWIERVGAEV